MSVVPESPLATGGITGASDDDPLEFCTSGSGRFIPNQLPATDRTLLQRLVAKGFAHPQSNMQSVCVVREDPHRHLGPQDQTTGIAIMLPTMLGRVAENNFPAFLDNLVKELAEARRVTRSLRLFVAMQYGNAELATAMQSIAVVLSILDATMQRENFAVPVTAIISSGPGKVLSLNQMLELAAKASPEAIILIDDDVGFSGDCFAKLISAYRRSEPPIAIGVTKIGRPHETRASRILFRMKSHTQPAEAYPHACCMIVSTEVISPAIPEIYSSDDGYICFRLLAAADANPLQRLKLIDDAYCHHLVGGSTTRQIRGRIRRMLLHHHLFLSHAKPQSARFYLAKLLFFGLWPWVPFDRSKGAKNGAIKLLLKYLYAVWFGKIGVELIIRGLLGRPLQTIKWGTADV